MMIFMNRKDTNYSKQNKLKLISNYFVCCTPLEMLLYLRRTLTNTREEPRFTAFTHLYAGLVPVPLPAAPEDPKQKLLKFCVCMGTCLYRWLKIS